METKHTYTDDAFREALSQDSVADAEKIVGKSWKEDQSVGFLGMMLQGRKYDATTRMAQSRGDTWSGCPIEVVERVLGELGAERVLRIDFQKDEREHADSFNVWWGQGILYCYDTYYGNKSINSGHFYYCWRPLPGIERWGFTSSGTSTKDGIWYGNHDIRDPLKLRIGDLKANGEILPKWVADPRPWLLHYADLDNSPYSREKSQRIDLLNKERFAMLPAHVREACTPTEAIA